MKRLIIIVVLALLPFVGNAQLNVTSQTTKRVTLCSARMGNISLVKNGEHYFLSICSSNQFEDPEAFYLGDTKESCKETLTDLLGLFGSMSKEDRMDVDNAGETVTLFKYTNISLGFAFGHDAGMFWMSKSECKKFLSVL